MRALNLNPTEIEIEEMKASVDPGKKGHFTLKDLEKAVNERGKDKETLEDLV